MYRWFESLLIGTVSFLTALKRYGNLGEQELPQLSGNSLVAFLIFHLASLSSRDEVCLPKFFVATVFRVVSLVLALLGVTYADYTGLGFDTMSPVTVANFQCMKLKGYAYFIARIFQSPGYVDPHGIPNMKNAWAGIFPKIN